MNKEDGQVLGLMVMLGSVISRY